MSDLWDYDDEETEPLENAVLDQPAPQAALPEQNADSEDLSGSLSDDEPQLATGKKRGRPPKKDKAAAPVCGKSKRGRGGAAAAALTGARAQVPLAQQQLPAEVVDLLDSDADDDDDFLLAPTPAPDGKASAAPAPAATPFGGAPTGASKDATSMLKPETRTSLQKEYDLLAQLRAAQAKVAAAVVEDAAPEPEATPYRRPLAGLVAGLNRPATHRPLGTDANGGAAGSVGLGQGLGLGHGHGGEASGLAAGSISGAALGGGSGAEAGSCVVGATSSGEAAAAAAAAAAQPAEADRVKLKLQWGPNKDGSVMLRTVKSDPICKLLDRFRALAAERRLCADPKKIKFMLDGDDLAKTPNTTPEDLDLEDDMIIDVKLGAPA
ncbi:hypothetical protein CHLRE_09g402367v5 [Chlamydomonas reinhardtii]|uniref:Ubiquitin-like domain-containing protein n=1 Tax=Chlamydomonas reinhardtii TaxID=3055 RepID=A8J7Y9_CHLRE|nr:uncharacterized protein CHLRE_09g402367v5 [Chlamydomonas reinhardtii]PNW79150.1 hypothetical protein CHLRE_09g402367v5 [Chlamydomonas reinhardtii]|eukprot:XP_001697653.1 predicted protein [Chlamydomonas reinhardtii]